MKANVGWVLMPEHKRGISATLPPDIVRVLATPGGCIAKYGIYVSVVSVSVDFAGLVFIVGDAGVRGNGTAVAFTGLI